ncbi:hypothetical protein D3C80_2106800 [compost metagenome]
MAIGALPGIEHVGRVGDDQVERAGDVVEQVAGLHRNIGHTGQRGIDGGMTQGQGVDVHRADLRVRRGTCDQ